MERLPGDAASFSFEFLERVEEGSLKLQIRNLLFSCADEFVPSLFTRKSPLEADPGGGEGAGSIQEYAKEMLSQSFLVCRDPAGRLAGFMSFRRLSEHPEVFFAGDINYISTICVQPEYRRKGLLRRFYDLMVEDSPLFRPVLATRTWSTNTPHIRVLEDKGFSLTSRKKDHRGPGIDTVYYAKALSKDIDTVRRRGQ